MEQNASRLHLWPFSSATIRGGFVTFDCAHRIINDMTSYGPRLHFEFDVSSSYLFQDCTFLMKQNQELGQIVQLLNETGEVDDRDVNFNCGSKYGEVSKILTCWS